MNMHSKSVYKSFFFFMNTYEEERKDIVQIEQKAVKHLARPMLSFSCLSTVADRMFHSEGLGWLLQTELHFHCKENKQQSRHEESPEYSEACFHSVVADTALGGGCFPCVTAFAYIHLTCATILFQFYVLSFFLTPADFVTVEPAGLLLVCTAVITL